MNVLLNGKPVKNPILASLIGLLVWGIAIIMGIVLLIIFLPFVIGIIVFALTVFVLFILPVVIISSFIWVIARIMGLL